VVPCQQLLNAPHGLLSPPDPDQTPSVPRPAAPEEDRSLSRIIARLRQGLSRRRPPRDFSEESLALILERQAEFVEELGLEAIAIARRAQSDVVSKVDVEQADRLVRASSASRVVVAAQSLGGVLLGAGLSGYVNVIFTKHPTTIEYVAATVFSVLGAAILTYGLTRRR
jgi:hypothetical protein